jgi:hypothetical protein
VEGLKRIPGAGGLLGNADTALRSGARAIRESAAGNFAESGDRLAPAFDQARERWRGTLDNVGGMFADAWESTGDLLGTSGEQAALAGAAARLQARLAAEDAKAKTREQANPAKPPGNAAPADGGGPPPGQAAAGAVRLPPGAFASAINLIMGRSANELILDETKKQTEAQRQMVAELRQINGKLDARPASSAPARPVPLVDTVARFA